MRSLLDLRLGRVAFVLLAAVSAAATAIILLGAHTRTPAQLAALAALRRRPAPQTGSVSAGAGSPATTATTAAPAAGAGSGSSAGSGAPGGGSSSSGASAAAPAAAPSPTTPATSRPASATTTTSATKATTASALPKVGHVFEITVSASSEAAALGAHSKLPYLRSLQSQATVLSGYRSLGHGELADELALVSGQAPNPDTTKGCPIYLDFPQSAPASAAGVVSGRGCVYPDSALTIGDQVTAAGRTWHAYVADMGKNTCVHPNSDATDDVALPGAEPGYDTRHNPFIYFHSLLDLGDCANDDVDLAHLPHALRVAKATPEFDYVAADACADGDATMLPAAAPTATTTTASATTTTAATSSASTPTTVAAGSPTTASTSSTVAGAGSSTSTSSTTASSTTTAGTSTTPATPATPATAPAGCPSRATAGPAAENAFLRRWVPRILRSVAYRRNGVLVITVARSGAAIGHPVRSGALVLSRWARRGRRIATACDPFALLRLDEDALRLKHLAHAQTAPALASQVLAGDG